MRIILNGGSGGLSSGKNQIRVGAGGLSNSPERVRNLQRKILAAIIIVAMVRASEDGNHT